ncbi:fibronectin type III domain-containing protein [Paenibacillus sp. N3.4]|uniref:RCC1 domain-containing protein n=1 Tax=Paenibacillus sp. N3.4 TaxID=2603222 RepID=UPI0011CC09D2|nr:fibronectin type III domain-containing protein [Paenibacillus sp. N3.4]TXK75433.1 hypothetical protein FU659_27490 [Paenibacillus sp. N3.4]
MDWKWSKKISPLVIGAVLLTLVPFGGVTASPQLELINSPFKQSFVSNTSQIISNSTSHSLSEALLSNKSSNSTESSSLSDEIKQPDAIEQNSVSTGAHDDIRLKAPNSVHALKELVDKRNRNSKTYLNSDGTTSVQTSEYSLNYFEGQAWQDIDTTIRPDKSNPSYTHSMLKNNFKVKLNNRGINQSVTFAVYDQSVTYKAIGMNNVTGDVSNNITTYFNAWQSTDLLYQVQNDQMKMELHLADNKAPKTFVFDVTTNNVNYRQNPDDSIDFINNDGDLSFQIPRMWVRDASSNENRYDKLKINFRQNGNKTLLELTLDDNNLQYPLVIDPTTTLPVIAGGKSHILELRRDGTVWAWGKNDYGQLGNGTQTYSYNFVQVSQLSDVIAVATGANHSLALKQDGTVWAWGSDIEGQLGNRYQSISPRTPAQVDQLSNIVSIAAGADYSVALKNDGTVWTWGNNSYGQLGNGTISNSSRTPVRTKFPSTQFPSTVNIATIAVGSNNTHSLALDTNGNVWAWGSNSYGQSGKASSSGVSSPVQVIKNVKAIAAGHNFSIALTLDGNVWTWGKNNSGQLGNGWTSSYESRPIQVYGISNVIGVSAGEDHSLILKQDGTVWAWGGNYYGQLGNGGAGQNSSIPIQVSPPLQGSSLTNIVAVVAGVNYSIAINQDRFYWVWGDMPFTGGGLRFPFPMYVNRPEPPTSLTVTGKTSNSVSLSWIPPANNEGIIRYYIYDNTEQTNGPRLVGNVDGNTTAYTVTNLLPNSKYAFTVSASRDFYTSGPSNSMEVFTNNTAPTTPSNLMMSSNTNSTISLTWTASTDNVGVTGYDIYMSGKVVGSVDGNTTTYTVPGLIRNYNYWFSVKAKNAAGEVSVESKYLICMIDRRYRQYYYDASGRIDYIQLLTGQKLKHHFDANGNLLNIEIQ